jgi:hypothetical protein
MIIQTGPKECTVIADEPTGMIIQTRSLDRDEVFVALDWIAANAVGLVDVDSVRPSMQYLKGDNARSLKHAAEVIRHNIWEYDVYHIPWGTLSLCLYCRDPNDGILIKMKWG